jgi:S1-C subfamily serine protease
MSNGERRLALGLGCLGLLAVMCLTGLGGALYYASQDQQAQVSDQAPEQVTAGDEASIENILEPAEAPLSLRRAESSEAPRAELPLREAVDGPRDLSRLYEQVNPGVVSLVIEQNGNNFAVGGGSGFIYDEQHIVTNDHVAGNASGIEVVFYDGSRRRGQLVGSDPYSDLAIVRVEDMPEQVRKLPLEDDFRSLKVGQPVVAIGSPFGNNNSMSAGIISALGRTIPADPQTNVAFQIPETIQTDAAINPGNSGGPLINLQGEVVGVNAQINTNIQSGGVPGSAGVGFSIPASVVAKVAPSLIRQGRHDWSYLGVSGLNDQAFTVQVAKANGLSEPVGAYLIDVLGDGPSAGKLRGAQPNQNGANPPVGGDVVLAVDGVDIHDFDDLLTYIAIDTNPGQEIELLVLRDGQEKKVKVTVGARPKR